MTDLFTVRKYRDQWTFKSPFTGEIIAEGETGKATYLVIRNDDAYIGGGETVGHITVTGAITEDPVPALAAGKTRPRMVEDDTLPDIPLAGFWHILIGDTTYSKCGAELKTRSHVTREAVFDIETAIPERVQKARDAALASVPAADKKKIFSNRLVVCPTKDLEELINNG